MVACNHHTSVYSPVDFRKPLDGTAPGVIPASQGSKYDSADAHFLHSCFASCLLALFSCFPVRTCTSFLFSDFMMTGNVFTRLNCTCMNSLNIAVAVNQYSFCLQLSAILFEKTCQPRTPVKGHVCVSHSVPKRLKKFQQVGNLVSMAGCPTKRAMPRLIWRLIISTYLLLRPSKPYKCVPPEE